MRQTPQDRTIRDVTDADLRQLLFQKDHVIVKFIDRECRICKELAPSFEELSKDPAYSNVLFLRMDAFENPVSRKEVKFSSAPFIVTYYKGILKDCGLVNTKAEVTELLQRLLA